jgi:catechol 2,3-dioxygenase-like lactoylglutathione lyase family enzyme
MVTVMRTAAFLPAMMLSIALAPAIHAQTTAGSATLPPPAFHHLHLNATNPDAAIDFYTKQFPSTGRAAFAGSPALKAGNVYVLFTKVAAPPRTEPQTAIWHFGWHVVDVRGNLATYQESHVPLLPLYTSEEGGVVYISSDAMPGAGGTLGRTKAQLAQAKAEGVKPVGGAGFAYLQGPDGAIIEYQGNLPVERFNHVHMYQEDPFCAALWYQKHLEATTGGRGPQHTQADCKVPRSEKSWPALDKEGTSRIPGGGVAFGDVGLFWYANQGDRPLVNTRGQLYDHFALSVTGLDAWIAKLRAENVRFLEQTYKLGDSRAVLIEGPSREAIELVEVK